MHDVVVLNGKVDFAIAVWLDAKSKRSGSTRTLGAYKRTINSFRDACLQSGYDLAGDPRVIALIAQAWVSHTVTGKTVSPNTHNLRLAIVSSFYAFAIKRSMLPITTNPIALVERRPAQAYANAHGIPATTIAQSLKAINRRTIAGKRDYALLSVALQTGRRLSELCHLECRDIEVEGNTITLHWRRTKGGKTISDTLPTAVSKALMYYLSELYPNGIPNDSSPVWVSFKGPDRTRGKALGRQAVADLCEKCSGPRRSTACGTVLPCIWRPQERRSATFNSASAIPTSPRPGGIWRH
jgi:site-specific recombinase XerD